MDTEGSLDMVPGLIAGGVGALLAVLLSLPLHSPDDIFFNSLTVGLAGAVLALAAAAIWNAVQRSANAVRTFELALGAAFALVVVAAFAVETQLSSSLAYIVPLAAVDFGAIALLTPLLASRPMPAWVGPAWAGPAAVVLPLVLGAALVGQRDSASAALALPGSTAATTATSSASTAGSSPTTAASAAPAGPRTPADVQGVTYVVSQGSTAQFVVREKLAQLPLPNDATIKNTALSGNVHLDGRPTVVNLEMSKFSSDQPMRDRFINQQWGRSNPTATVTINDLGSLPSSYRTGETVKQKVSGTIKVLGNEVPISFDVEAKIDEAGVLNVLGTTTFKWSDLKMNAPSTSSVSVQDTVNAHVLLIARPTRA